MCGASIYGQWGTSDVSTHRISLWNMDAERLQYRTSAAGVGLVAHVSLKYYLPSSE